jgi:N6-adenosine-specific RNA methylase IME4
MIPFHPLADIFPLIEGPDFEDLIKDIATYGLREPITLLDGKILDGRNRFRASVAAKLLPETLDELKATQIKHFRHYTVPGAAPPPQEELIAFVVSKNLRRRQLDDDQRRMVAARMVNLRQGRPTEEKTSQSENISREKAAEMLTSDVPGIDRARAVLAHGVPEMAAAVEGRKITVATAAEIVKALAPEEQRKLLADVAGAPDTKKAFAGVVKEIRAEKQVVKKERRDSREADLGAKILAMPEKQYGVAIEDFEWDHKPWSRETGMDRHPANHYPTAADAHTPEEIVARTAERFKCLADACVLYAWTTIPHLAIAMKVLELRGFTYKSQRVWDKVRAGKGRGPGYWVTGEHEILLIATRGDVVAPANARFPSRFEAPVSDHSVKPDKQYEHAEYHFPNIPKIELNARRARPGWQSWGYEAPLPKNDPDSGPALNIPSFLPSREPASDYPEFPDCLKRSAGNVAPFFGGP